MTVYVYVIRRSIRIRNTSKYMSKQTGIYVEVYVGEYVEGGDPKKNRNTTTYITT